MESLKRLVIGLDGATPEQVFEDERLVNLRRLMEAGFYGPLQSVIPPSSELAWTCLASGQDPGSLGVYGPRNRVDRSYSWKSIESDVVWNELLPDGGKVVLVGERGECAPGRPGGIDKASLRDEIFAATRSHFTQLREVLAQGDWNLIRFVECGLARLERAFGIDDDPEHGLHQSGSPHREVIHDYYKLLDLELGSVLELLDERTAVLIVSVHGAQKCLGGFCVNQWLLREGLLTAHRQPDAPTPLSRLDIDWSKTRVWSEGSDCASLSFNVKGREPEGVIDPSEYGAFRAEIKARLEAITDPEGKRMGTLVLEPEMLYRSVRNIAPDLIVQFGGMAWRAIDGLGYSTLHPGPDEIEAASSPAMQGVFVLAVPGLPGAGPVDGATLLDMAPTLRELGGQEPSPQAQGRSLLYRPDGGDSPDSSDLDPDELLIRERLSGLGYLG